ncbi:MAG: CcmD family protein [Actinomycetes bacterium]|nr:CcmD family protein [Actinomycetes bacterium]
MTPMGNLIDPTNTELYALVLKDAPYVIVAYAVLWVALVAYVTVILRRMLKLNREIEVLSEVVDSKAQAGE